MFSTPERIMQRTFWLRKNTGKYKINICVEDSMVSKLEDIKEYLSSTGSFIIQEGKKIWVKQMDEKLNINKEAIVCWRVRDYEHFNYYAFLYRPKCE